VSSVASLQVEHAERGQQYGILFVSRCRGIGPPSGNPSSGLCFCWPPTTSSSNISRSTGILGIPLPALLSNIFVFSLFYENSNLEYVRVPFYCRVNVAEDVIRIGMAASQEYVNAYSTRKVVWSFVVLFLSCRVVCLVLFLLCVCV